MHSLVTRNQIRTRGFLIIGDDDRWKIVAQVLYKELSQASRVTCNVRLSIDDLWRSIFSFIIF